jgi:uncharacterized membrane protein
MSENAHVNSAIRARKNLIGAVLALIGFAAQVVILVQSMMHEAEWAIVVLETEIAMIAALLCVTAIVLFWEAGSYWVNQPAEEQTDNADKQ